MLVVSTDPAHSLGDALGRRLGPEPIALPLPLGRGGRRAAPAAGALWAAEIAAERALERWLTPRRAGLAAAIERGTYLDAADAAGLLSLTPPGVDELAAILELPRLAAATRCEEVVVDTAPTAHTLRLVAAPETLEHLAAFLDGLQERHRELAAHFGPSRGLSRPLVRTAAGGRGAAASPSSPADAAIADLAAAAGEVAGLLRDPRRAAFVWLLLPEALAVAETLDGIAALELQGVEVQEVVVNRLTPASPPASPLASPLASRRPDDCPLCRARRASELAAVAALRRALPGRALRFLPALAREPRGRAALRAVGRALAAPDGGAALAREDASPAARSHRPARRQPASGAAGSRPPALHRPAWLGLIAPPGVRLLLFGGKGGVGKTTCAAAAALALAERSPRRAGDAAGAPARPVLVLSTDPAHSLGDAFDTALDDSPRPIPGGPPNLLARELDAGRTFAAWHDRLDPMAGDLVAALTGAPGGSSDLAELAPAGMDELVALATLIDAMDETGGELVVVDTAPTGHTLRLLALPDLALAWDHALLALLLKYREAARPGRLAAELVGLAHALRRFTALLADPARTRFVAVTRPAELPRRETARLLAALARLRIEPAAILANAVPPPAAARCGRCGAESAAAARQLAALGGAAAGRCALLSAPLAIPPPRGTAALRDWARRWRIESR